MTSLNKIILINIIVFVICQIATINGIYLENVLALFPIYSDSFSLHQILTHLFVHADLEHLFFNMLLLFLVGKKVECILKDKFTSFYLLGGFFSSGLYCLIQNNPIIGASGAVYAVITFYILSTTSKFTFDTILNNLGELLITLFLISSILAEIYLIFRPDDSQIGHIAHILGVIFGFIYYRKHFDHR